MRKLRLLDSLILQDVFASRPHNRYTFLRMTLYANQRQHLLAHPLCEKAWDEYEVKEDCSCIQICFRYDATKFSISCHRTTPEQIKVQITGDLTCQWTFANPSRAADFALNTAWSAVERTRMDCNLFKFCKVCASTRSGNVAIAPWCHHHH